MSDIKPSILIACIGNIFLGDDGFGCEVAKVLQTRNLPENVKDNLLGLLHRLVRQGSAYVDRKGGYVIDDQALIESETRLEALLKRKRARAALMGLTHDDARLMLEPQDGAPRPRRGLGALERYLSPRFLNQTAAAEDGEQGA